MKMLFFNKGGFNLNFTRRIMVKRTESDTTEAT